MTFKRWEGAAIGHRDDLQTVEGAVIGRRALRRCCNV
jgi:hypothetical protein